MQQAYTTSIAIFFEVSPLFHSSLFVCCCVIPLMHHIHGRFFLHFHRIMHHILGTSTHLSRCNVHHFRVTFRRLCMPFHAHFRGVLIAHIVRRYAPYSWVNSQILRMIQCTSYVGAFSKLYSSFVCHLRGTYFCVASLSMLF